MKRYLPWLWAALITILLSPNLLYINRASFFGGSWDALQFVAFSLLIIVLPICLLPTRLALIVLAPMTLFIPAAYLHIMILGSPISRGMILSSVYSTPHETMQALQMRPEVVAFALVVAILGLSIAISMFVKNTVIPWRIKWKMGSLALIAHLLITVPLDAYNSGTKLWEHPAWKLDMLLGNREHAPFADTFPVGLLFRFARVAVDVRKLDQWKDQRAQTSWTVKRLSKASESELHVVIIGESSRRDHWQLYGYNRETTPMVSAEKSIWALKDLIAPSNVTISSVTQLLSRASPTQIEKAYNEPSITAAFAQAGFNTYWISNSEMIGRQSTPITMMANDAQQTSFLANLSSETLDEVLVDGFRKALLEPHAKKFIVLHMKGSHADYKYRFTAPFNKFLPSLFGSSVVDPSSGGRDEVINSYDNTLVYTDHILGKVLEDLKAFQGAASVTFVSDHGERLMDNGTRDIGHPSSQGTRAEFEIPFFFWMNKNYADSYPEKMRNLENNKDLPASSLILFDSLLGLADLQIEGHEVTKDIFSDHYRGSARPILLPNGEVVDFDKDIYPAH